MTWRFGKPPKRTRTRRNNIPKFTDGQILDSGNLPKSRKARKQVLQLASSTLVLPGGRMLLRMKGDAKDEMEMDEDMQANEEDWVDDGGYDMPAPLFEIQEGQFAHTDESRLLQREKAKTSREKRRRRWHDEVLPRILPHYLAYLASRHRKGVNGQSPILPHLCICQDRRCLNIVVLRWNVLEDLSLNVCECEPAMEQLLKRGLFPCSPMRPSVATDIDLIELISSSFLYLSLNVTGWADLLLDFWAVRGFHLKHKTVLRRQLADCIVHYQQLQQLRTNHLDSILEPRRVSLTDRQASFIPEPPIQVSPAPSTPETKLSRPSESLRSKCPLCFGGAKPELTHSSVDAIVCLDACFSQKRRKSKYTDGLHITNKSYFISKELIDQMEKAVSQLRARKAGGTLAAASTLQVPNEILDDCERSFLAAQESNTKATRNFFADTGLMALLCRHDRVLFLANLTSTGEKQHYALALLDALFEEIPPDWRVGVLYDIGCQLHRSCEKYNFLSKYRSRIVWSISVFHAYGHQWACQLVYHPRKRKDFGYSDGEGCERLWSSLSPIVAPLRVSGFHRRIFYLNLRLQHTMAENLKNAGQWLLRKQRNLNARLPEARKKLIVCPIPVRILRMEWKNQVESQTRPIPRKSQRATAHAIGRLILLRSEVQDAEQHLTSLREQLSEQAGNPQDDEVLEDAEGNVAAIRAKVQIAERTLGTGLAYTTLEDARTNKFLESRLKALAIKQRLLARLQARKFEYSKLDQHSHRPAFGNKLYVHTKGAIHRREIGIKAMAYSFNRLVDTMTALRRTNRYKDEILPEKINIDHLFRLDVFSNIWRDDGLLPEVALEERWRSDQMVRDGINTMLDLDRCQEEGERLRWEVRALATWAQEEVRVTSEAFEAIDEADTGTRHTLVSQLSKLSELIENWNSSVGDIFSGDDWFTPSLNALGMLPRLPIRVYGTGNGNRMPERAMSPESSASDNDSDGSELNLEGLIAMEASDDEEVLLPDNKLV